MGRWSHPQSNSISGMSLQSSMLNILKIFTAGMVIALTTVVVAVFLSFVTDAPWFRFPLTAILAYGIAMAMIYMLRQIAPLSLPQSYFRVRRFENGGRLYLRFGIRIFRKLLVVARIDACNWLVRFSGRRSGLQNFAKGVRQAETDHLIAFLVVLLVFNYAFARGWYEVAGWLALVNVFANVYPVMLQRYNRARIESLLNRKT
jgi:Glycosyl-4,4'-diaponeurosporenoate acyltransferase